MTVLTEAISELSSSPTYERIEDWYKRLKLTLASFDFEIGPLPDIHTNEGAGYIEIIDISPVIYFTWYRMDQSGRWEIICYLTGSFDKGEFRGNTNQKD